MAFASSSIRTGLGDVPVHTGVQAALPVGGHGVRRQGQDGDSSAGYRSRRRISRVASNPSISGIWMSIRIRSNGSFSTAATLAALSIERLKAIVKGRGTNEIEGAAVHPGESRGIAVYSPDCAASIPAQTGDKGIGKPLTRLPRPPLAGTPDNQRDS
jgi:hypothetical protein